MRTYVTAPTMRPAACLALNACESFPGLLRELRAMKKKERKGLEDSNRVRNL